MEVIRLEEDESSSRVCHLVFLVCGSVVFAGL